MGRKRMATMMMAFIVFLVGPSLAQDADPSLVGYWKFEGDWLDSSGNGRSGTPVGDATFGPGLEGQALSLDGSGDYVTIDSWMGIEGGNPFTISLWVNSTATDDRTMVCWGSSTNGQRVDFRLFQGRLRVEHGNGNLQGNTVLADGEWHHAALTVAAGASIQQPGVTLYLDGVNDSQTATDPDTFNITPTVPVTIGQRRTHNNRAFLGLLDEVRIYDRELTAAEIEALAAHPKAYGPSPADGTVGVTNPLLSWTPRETALFHDVYLGTDPNLGADQLVAPRWMATVYWHAPGLEPGTTYYWKVDEIDPDQTVHPGDVWSFVYSPHEAWQPQPADGEPYMDPNVTLTWLSGLTGVSHDVYLGTDPNAVAEGTGDTFKDNLFETTYVTGDLQADTRYYWRIDEVGSDGTKVTGNVWTFKTVAQIPVTDPSLVAWWTLDEGAGTRVVDWSGHGHHGDFAGNPQWVSGYDGGALRFNGVTGEHVEMFGYDGVLGTQDRTVTAWIKTGGLGDIISWGQNVTSQKWIFRVQDNNGNPGTIRVEVSGGRICGWTDVRDDEWHHAAAVLESAGAPTVSNIRMYLDGWQEAISDSQVVDINTVGGRNVWIGDGHHDRPFPGLIDDVRIYDKALTQEEIDLVMRIDPLRAWRPYPAHGAIADVRTATPLTWMQGDSASKHDVYFGTDEAAVAAADATDTTGIYRNRITSTNYTPAENLGWGQKYFWRVDEFNTDGSTTTGKVWTFTVADYLVVDDFESYTDDWEVAGDAIWQTWIDGIEDPPNGGSQVGNVEAPFAERTIVYSGSQAMPLDYNNVNSPWYSEAYRTWDTPQNWTFNGVNTLVVFFRGQPPSFLETGPDAMTLSAAGWDIWHDSGLTRFDEFRFVYKRLSGDGSIIARVDSITNSNAWAKGGVMIRETLDWGSRHASVFMTPGNGVAFQWRLANYDAGLNANETGVQAPHWVKLTRSGNLFTAQHSADGVAWEDVTHATNPTSDTIIMGGSVYIGVALTSHAENTVCTAEFSGLQTTGQVTGPWQIADVGVAHPGNAPDSLYVAVQDKANKVAVVTHPDPAATTLTAWQPWMIDLSALAGVNVSAVKTMYIGVGDRDNPQPGGTGRIYIDDIRVIQMPVLTLEPSTDMVATGDKGMILSINGIDVNDLILGTTSFADEPKYADQGPAGADNFDLNADASADEQAYVDVLFAQPVTTIFMVEKGGNDTGFIQALYENGAPVGDPVAFSPDSYGKPGYIVYQDQAGALMVIKASVPIYGIRILPPETGVLGIDPVSVSAIAK